jgi:hypothetical protein
MCAPKILDTQQMERYAMENIINLTFQLKEFAEMEMSAEMLAEMQALTNKISGLQATQVAA